MCYKVSHTTSRAIKFCGRFYFEWWDLKIIAMLFCDASELNFGQRVYES